MAVNWIKWCKGLASRREVIVLASVLERDRHEIAGRLMTLWEWCDDNFADPDIDPDSEDVSLFLGDRPHDFLDDLLGIDGFCKCLMSDSIRWLTILPDDRVRFRNLARHNGSSAKQRANQASKKQNQRSAKDVPILSPKERDNCPPEIGTKTGTREEKRREEYKDYPTPNFIGGEPRIDQDGDELPPTGLPEDPLAVEAWFSRRWNCCAAISSKIRSGLPHNLEQAFWLSWNDDHYREQILKALKRLKRPFSCGKKIKVQSFLEQTTLDDLADGTHNWLLTDETGQRKPRVATAEDMAAWTP